MALLPVDEALARILDGVAPLASEDVPLAAAYGRTLAENLVATRRQPPFAASAMDGYAVRAADMADGAMLLVIGTSAAGRAFPGPVGEGQAVRIFTGAPVPDGADTVLIQENAEAEGQTVRATEPVVAGANIRRAGLDFGAGDTLLEAGAELGLGEIALAAATGRDMVPVRRRPVVAILATGDELVPPGTAPRSDQIFASTGVAVAAYLAARGATTHDLGIAADDLEALGNAIDRATALPADLLVTIGGVSVGDHDLVQPALASRGMSLDFWRIAMRPGKPLMFGRLGDMRVIGLPGNPVSSITTLLLFVQPLVTAFLGRRHESGQRDAVLGVALPANGERADYMRARTFGQAPDGLPVVAPLPVQDSSQLSALVAADCLLVRAAHSDAAAVGERCRIIPLK